MKKLVIAAAVLAGLGTGAYFLWPDGGAAAAASGRKTETRRVKAERGDMKLTVSATGEVTPLRVVELKSKASGQVVRFPKLEGATVDAGELIAELDKKVEQRNLTIQEANFSDAEARLSLLKLETARALAQMESELGAATADASTKQKELERVERLDTGLMSETEVATARLNARMTAERAKQVQAGLALTRDRRQADENLAASEVARARLAVDDARERLADTEVRSPISGILLGKLVEEGQIVSSGISSNSGGTAIASVADVTALIVVTNVDETDIGKVRTGQDAFVSVEAHPDKRFKGRVELIPPKGTIDSSIIVFKVKIGLEGKHFGVLKAGMTATVSILCEERKSVVHVPSEAVRNERGRKYVLAADGTTKKEVKTGLDDGTRCEIVEGLQEGEEIAVVTTVQPSGAQGGRRRGFP